MMKFNLMHFLNHIFPRHFRSSPPFGLLACRFLFLVILFITGSSIKAQDDTTVSSEYRDEIPGKDDTEATEEDTPAFREKWNGDTLILQHRTIPRDIIQSQKNNKAFWYADKSFGHQVAVTEDKESRNIPLWDRTWFQTLLWLLIIGGFATAIAIYLANHNVSLFRKKVVRYENENEDFIPEDIFSINYQKEIDKAVAAGNFRLAIRLMYLRLLKAFSDKSIIKYQQDKTNFDYLLELHKTRHYQDFFRVTRHYEYSWYGKFDVSRENFERVRKEFSRLESSIY